MCVAGGSRVKPNLSWPGRGGATLVAACVVILAAASTTRAEQAKSSRRKADAEDAAGKPWINAKGLCVFQFGADGMPLTADGFALALEDGCRKGARLPADAQVVEMEGAETYPTIRALRVNFSDAKIDFDPKRKTAKPPENYVPHGGFRAASFQVLGHRLAVEDAHLSVGVTARDVRFDFTRDRRGRPFLMLAEAREGEMLFEATYADLESLIYSAFRDGARPYGVLVNRARLRLSSDEVGAGHSIVAELKVDTTFAGLPAGLKFRARFDVDDQLNGRISDLTCTGDKVLGPLISGVIQPALRKYDGKTRPLVSFPKGAMQLHEVKIDTEKDVRLSAKFGK
jgi:hypothetical protein